VGVVVATVEEPALPAAQIRPVEQVLDDMPPLPEDWMRMARFAADYYQRPLGEVMLPALPAPLRKPAAYQGKRAAGGPLARLARRRAPAAAATGADVPPQLNAAQQGAVQALAAANGYQAVLLHGVTGSGKTEVYL